MRKLLLALAVFPWIVLAQSDMILEHYTQQEGLPSNTVYGSLKGSDGFLWIGTWHGLCSFDGSQFTAFINRTSKQSEMPPQKVLSIVDDDHGFLWLRNVDNRLYLFNKRTEHFHEVYNELKSLSQNVQVIKIQRMDNSHVLLLTRNKNLYEAFVSDSGMVKIERLYDARNDIDPATMKLLHNVRGETDKRVFWIGMDYHIDAIEKGSRQPQSVATYTDSRGNIWTVENEQILICRDSQTGLERRFTIPSGERITELKFADSGANGVFILLPTGELWYYHHSTSLLSPLSSLNTPLSALASARFYDIYRDNDGQLWVSSTDAGLYKIAFPPQCFHLHLSELLTSPLHDNRGFRAVFQQRNGDIWVGTRNGQLFCVDGKTMTLKHQIRESVGNVYHIMEDKKGVLWISTKGAGLTQAVPDGTAPGGWRMDHYVNQRSDKYSISNDRVYYTYEDSKGRLWVCTFGGGLNLAELRNGRLYFYHKGNSFKHYPAYDLYMSVRSITEDKDGRLWVATTDGLMSFDGSFKDPTDIQFEIYRDAEASAVDGDIFSLYKDRSGNIWMSTFGGGLSRIIRYDARRHVPVLSHLAFDDQTNGNVVSSMVEDKEGRMWLFTENTLASLDSRTGFIRHYGRQSGFPAVTIEDNTAVCLSSGQILVGCREGMLSFNPSEVDSENSRRLPTFIVDFKVQNRSLTEFDPPIYDGSIRYAKEIVLKHHQNMFTIEFTTLDFISSGTLSYTYILDGYEDQWHISGKNRVASYANVPPGKYQFRVKPMGNDQSERILLVTILPPWWATWWAYCIYALIFAALLYGVFKLVREMIRMRNEVYINDRLAELKIRFFTNVSHELRTPLTLIKGPVEELKKNEKLSPAGKEYVSLIDSNARKMLQLVNQILDFRKVQNGKMKLRVSCVNLTQMLEQFRQEYRILADERRIAYHFDLPQDSALVWCDAEKVNVVVNNLINNAFKFTHEGGTIHVMMEYDEQSRQCMIRVEDDGDSIPEAQLEEIFERFAQADLSAHRASDHSPGGTGIGLSLSREYVNMHHGRIWAENLPGGQGAAFVVELPIDKEHFADDAMVVYLNDQMEMSVEALDDSESSSNTETLVADDAPVILLIEDNIDLCRMLSLQMKGKYNLYIAHDGEDGLKKVYQYHPDVIVSDLMMPGIDGIEVLRRVRHDFSISHIPVIILTAKQGDDVHKHALTTGANAYITKPFSSEILLARIEQLLEEQRIFQRKMAVKTGVSSQEPNEGNNAGTERSHDSEDAYEQHLIKQDLDFVQRIHQIVEENLQDEDFRIDNLASEMGLSRSAFFKKLKSLTGFAPVDYVKEIRLVKAQHLIETTTLNITEVAYAVGFRDAGYFTKCFRQKYGTTPKEYRKREQ